VLFFNGGTARVAQQPSTDASSLPGTFSAPLQGAGRQFPAEATCTYRTCVRARPTGVDRADAINIRIPIEGAGALTAGEIA
jgi:hypothetical protein